MGVLELGIGARSGQQLKKYNAQVYICMYICSCMYWQGLCTLHIFTGLQVCCGNKNVRARYFVVNVLSSEALPKFNSFNSTPPSDPVKFALRLLGTFFSCEERATL